MCYYSTTLEKGSFRDAKVGENLHLRADYYGHHFAVGDSDKMIVCVLDKTEVHIEKLELSGSGHSALAARDSYDQLNRRRTIRRSDVKALLGKPVSGVFKQLHGDGSDWIIVDGIGSVHLSWLSAKTRMYTGAKRVSLETRLGMDDPSIVNDHRFIDEMPTLNKVPDPLCSVTR